MMTCRAPVTLCLCVATLLATAGGCQPKSQPTTQPTTMAAVIGPIPADILMVKPQPPGDPATGAAGERSPTDPQAATARQKLLGLDTYVINIPIGTVSRNEAFWKRVNEEDPVSPTQYDLLRRNGVRVGQAKVEDWPFFKDLMDSRPATYEQQFSVTVGGSSVTLEMKKDVATENVWYFDSAGRLTGRTYENCQNLWSLSYQAVARNPDHVRIAMSPLIRSQRKKLGIVPRRSRPEDPPSQEVAYVAPEYLFDLSLEADVPPGRFLVMAPSSEATGGTVGEAFMTGEGIGQRVEKVILLVPRTVPATVRTVQPQ